MRLTTSLEGSWDPPITQVKRGGSFLSRLTKKTRQYSRGPRAVWKDGLYWSCERRRSEIFRTLYFATESGSINDGVDGACSQQRPMR